MKYITRKPMKTFTEEFDLSVYVAEIKKFELSNQKHYEGILAEWRSICDKVKLVYGNRHKVYKYMRRNPPEKPVSLKSVIRKTKKNYEAMIERDEQRKKNKAYRHRRKEAIQMLESLGLEPGVDFKMTSAISYLKKNTINVNDTYVLIKDIQIV